jgi:5'-3' exonuclease
LTRALIDGDELIFKACAATSSEIDWDTGTSESRPVTFKEARESAERRLEAWVEAAGADDYLVVLSPRDRKLFRRGLFAAYKGERGEKPQHFWKLDAYIRDNHDALDYPGLEADDTMGLLSGPGQVIVSSDKDMKTVPGLLYNPGKKQKGVISQARADWQWMYQTLTGDPTDGFGGCTGCGATGAEALLADAAALDAWWPLVVERFCKPKTKRYADQPQAERDAVLMAQLARILRPGEYDPKTGAVSYRIARRRITFNAHHLAT